jgi:hypothetical protein
LHQQIGVHREGHTLRGEAQQRANQDNQRERDRKQGGEFHGFVSSFLQSLQKKQFRRFKKTIL